MEISPSQVMAMDFKRQVQKLLTLKQTIVFLANFSFFSFFLLYAIRSLLLSFTIWQNFTKNKTTDCIYTN
jgi:hypothetical protein